MHSELKCLFVNAMLSQFPQLGEIVSFYTGAAELDCDRVQRSPRVK